jgi:hypothetical protein
VLRQVPATNTQMTQRISAGRYDQRSLPDVVLVTRGFRYAIALLFALGAVNCTDARNKRLTQENLVAISKTNALTGEEVQLLQGYVLRTGMARVFSAGLAGALSGKDTSSLLDSTKTIRVAIEEQRKWLHDDSVSSAKQKSEADAALKRFEQESARLRGIVTVTPVAKSFSEGDYESYVNFRFVVKNNGDKAVAGFKGHVKTTDMFGDMISRLQIKEDDPLQPGAERVVSSSYGYNKYIDRDTKLRFTEFTKMKFVWEPELILFADGTQLAVPEAP